MSKIISVAVVSSLFAGLIAFSGVAAAQASDKPLTREQVVAQLQAARASGELARVQSENGSFSPIEIGSSRVSRAQVIEELKRSQASGEIDAAFRDSHAYPAPLVTKSASSPVTREQVKAELERARKSGEFARLNGNDSHVGL
ncbi:DUF4148 domain-containing protein [Roseateles amylovorans]|uniref:DUF4148 domain-containing protein n=1 Tax=Roseateles amylovorans TaxID=2978473 RepID=A0ABY6B2L0_9BURK|nr:DUF4148 domain-containing protein [Roseateles amylovorans]UXH79065.1 DUF4148 domain-containing protein [Roseateles amylovorans]